MTVDEDNARLRRWEEAYRKQAADHEREMASICFAILISYVIIAATGIVIWHGL